MNETKLIKDVLKNVVKKTSNINRLPIEFAREVKRLGDVLNPDQTVRAIEIVRNWIKYARENNIGDTPDAFAIRYHLSEFAKLEFGQKKEKVDLLSERINRLSADGFTYSNLIGEKTNPEILNDRRIAIFGGAARLALKMKAGVNFSTEMPLADVDIIADGKSDITAVSTKYDIDLTGTRVVSGNMLENVKNIATNVDCTMNEVAVYDGNLIYSERALADIKEGNIRLAGKDDPLFGSDGVVLPDGNIYMKRSGFYRTLSFLLRKKGQRIIVSKENIEQEKDNIGRYWLVILFIKLSKIKDERSRNEAVCNWLEVAKNIGSTNAATPLEFLKELLTKYPDTHDFGTHDRFDIDDQVKWIIGKLTSRSVENIFEDEEEIKLPTTYTPANIELPENTKQYDLNGFWEKVKSISSKP